MLTLADTTELMKSDDYKKRFVAEYLQLKIRHTKLRDAIAAYKAGKLTLEQTNGAEMWIRQWQHMSDYLIDLEIRAILEDIDIKKYM